MRPYATLLACLLPALAGCDASPPSHTFANTTPAFDPVRFWAGHTQSWGVVEDRRGGPAETVATDCVGEAEGANGLHMMQTLTEGDGTVTHREWHMRRVSPGHFIATANDMDGQAQGQAEGRVFHWRWYWKRWPNLPFGDLAMDQWMYFYPDGTLENRTTIRKFGIILAEVTEQFSRVN
jgi:hypothetical protein